MSGAPAQSLGVGAREGDGTPSRWRIVAQRLRPRRRRTVGHRERGRDERGQALVELILVLPVVLALTAGVFELGYYIHVRDVVDMAAAQAARTAAIDGAVTAGASAAATSILHGSGLSVRQAGYTLCVGGSCEHVTGGGTAGTICAFQVPGAQLPPVSVTVDYDYHLLFPFLRSPLFLGIGRAISGTFHEKVTLPAEVGWLPGSGPSTPQGQVICG